MAYAYLHAKGKEYRTEKTAIEQVLLQYRNSGMIASLKGNPRRKNPEKWFEIDIDFPPMWTGVVGIEGLGVGDPSNLILNHLLEVNEVRIVTDKEAMAGVQSLELHGIHAVESAGANFFTALELGKNLQCRGEYGGILTVVTAKK